MSQVHTVAMLVEGAVHVHPEIPGPGCHHSTAPGRRQHRPQAVRCDCWSPIVQFQEQARAL